MVTAIRDTETALGTGDKFVLDVESELHNKARRAVHAVTDISSGENLTTKNVKVLRPGEQEAGLHPKFYPEVIGKTAVHDIPQSAGIQWDDIDAT
jgi:N-acetylneuraminate synthase